MEMQINLLPPNLRPKPPFRWLVVFVICLVVTSVAVNGYCLFMLWIKAQVVENNISLTQYEITKLEYLKDKEVKLLAMEQQVEDILSDYSRGRPTESQILLEIENSLPKYVGLTNLSIRSDGILMSGFASSYYSASNLAMKLSVSSMFCNVKMNVISVTDEGDYSFNISCQLAWSRGEENEPQ